VFGRLEGRNSFKHALASPLNASMLNSLVPVIVGMGALISATVSARCSSPASRPPRSVLIIFARGWLRHQANYDAISVLNDFRSTGKPVHPLFPSVFPGTYFTSSLTQPQDPTSAAASRINLPMGRRSRLRDNGGYRCANSRYQGQFSGIL
jgi:hypothetical protein